jgi:hypothetical protein
VLKKGTKNPSCTSEHSMFTHNFLQRKDISYVKKIKSCQVNRNFVAPKLIFFTHDTISEFLDILKNAFEAVGASTRMSQSGYPIYIQLLSVAIPMYV